MQKLAHEDGEIGTSRAAASMGVAMCLSSYSTTSLEDVIKVGGDNPYIIQMCVVRDRNITAQLLRRAEGMGFPEYFAHPNSHRCPLVHEINGCSSTPNTAAGFKAIFVSVDVPVLGRRLNEMRNNFTLPEDLTFPNILSSGNSEFSDEGGNGNDYGCLHWPKGHRHLLTFSQMHH